LTIIPLLMHCSNLIFKNIPIVIQNYKKSECHPMRFHSDFLVDHINKEILALNEREIRKDNDSKDNSVIAKGLEVSFADVIHQSSNDHPGHNK